MSQYEIEIDDLSAGGVVVDQNATSPFTPPTLISGHSYRWWVRAAGSVWSTAADFMVGLPVLLAPSGGTSNNPPLFTWTAITGVSQYEIQISDLTGGGVIDKPVSGTNFTPSALVAGHNYRWWVRAAGAPGAVPRTLSSAAPAASTPTGTIAAVLPQFTWASTGAAQYEIYISDLVSAAVIDQTVSVTNFTPSTPLFSGHNYQWWVRPAGGTCEHPINFTVALPVLTGPAGTAGNALPTFAWNGLAGVAQYEFYLSDLVTGAVVTDQNVSPTTFTPATPLVSGHNYRWWVRVVGNGWSNPTDFTVALPVLIAPVAPVADVLPAFSWNGVTGISQYEIYVSDLSAGGIVDQAVTATTWTPTTPLVSGHSYRWWVRAAGSVWNAATDFTVARPTLTAPNGNVTGGLQLFTWTGLNNVTQYEIYVADLTTGTFVNHTVGTSWTASPALLSGHHYRWWVRALGSSSPGLWSDPLDFQVT